MFEFDMAYGWTSFVPAVAISIELKCVASHLCAVDVTLSSTVSTSYTVFLTPLKQWSLSLG